MNLVSPVVPFLNNWKGLCILQCIYTVIINLHNNVNIAANCYNRKILSKKGAPSIMKSTLKVHNPRVIILLICINDVQGKELSF